MSQKRMLFVFAHPDDESFTSAVTIAKYVREAGAYVSLVCATRGEAGKTGNPPVCSPDELPLVRERELKEACRILGIQHLEFMGYRDKHVSDVPPETLAQRVAEAVERHQPQVLVTFPPHGISGHPDHKAISQAATRAVRDLLPDRSPLRKLYYTTIPSTPQMAGSIFTDPYESITTVVSAPGYADLAAQALRAHRSQHLSVERVFPGVTHGDTRHVRTSNYFILAWHRLPGYRIDGKETDLFAGLT